MTRKKRNYKQKSGDSHNSGQQISGISIEKQHEKGNRVSGFLGEPAMASIMEETILTMIEKSRAGNQPST